MAFGPKEGMALGPKHSQKGQIPLQSKTREPQPLVHFSQARLKFFGIFVQYQTSLT
jgi:hypothetical protein